MRNKLGLSCNRLFLWLYLKGSISDHQDEIFWSYLENWLDFGNFCTKKIVSGKKLTFPFKLNIVITRPKIKILSSVFCKHSIFDSTNRFFNKSWLLYGVMGVTFQKIKVKIDQKLLLTLIWKVIKFKNMFIKLSLRGAEKTSPYLKGLSDRGGKCGLSLAILLLPS